MTFDGDKSVFALHEGKHIHKHCSEKIIPLNPLSNIIVCTLIKLMSVLSARRIIHTNTMQKNEQLGKPTEFMDIKRHRSRWSVEDILASSIPIDGKSKVSCNEYIGCCHIRIYLIRVHFLNII